MIKRILIAVMVLSLVSILGCTEISSLTQKRSSTSPVESLKILKAVELSSKWEMKQMRFKIAVGDELLILLKLSDGDKVDGYFYLEKGDNINFHISGETLVYKSEVQNVTARRGISSDRFSVVANQAQGNLYTLAFHNTADNGELQTPVTVFLEIIYPISGSVYVPLAGD